jgi:hypothetical protein
MKTSIAKNGRPTTYISNTVQAKEEVELITIARAAPGAKLPQARNFVPDPEELEAAVAGAGFLMCPGHRGAVLLRPLMSNLQRIYDKATGGGQPRVESLASFLLYVKYLEETVWPLEPTPDSAGADDDGRDDDIQPARKRFVPLLADALRADLLLMESMAEKAYQLVAFLVAPGQAREEAKADDEPEMEIGPDGCPQIKFTSPAEDEAKRRVKPPSAPPSAGLQAAWLLDARWALEGARRRLLGIPFSAALAEDDKPARIEGMVVPVPSAWFAADRQDDAYRPFGRRPKPAYYPAPKAPGQADSAGGGAGDASASAEDQPDSPPASPTPQHQQQQQPRQQQQSAPLAASPAHLSPPSMPSAASASVATAPGSPSRSAVVEVGKKVDSFLMLHHAAGPDDVRALLMPLDTMHAAQDCVNVAARRLHEGTRVAFMRSVDAVLSNVSSPPVLWVTGVAGAGKSVAVAAACKKEFERIVYSHVMCRDRPSLCSPQRFLASMANRFAQLWPQFKTAVADNLKCFKSPADVLACGLDQCFELLCRQPLSAVDNSSSTGRSAVVLDGWDELDAPERAPWRSLVALLAKKGGLPSWMCLIASSGEHDNLAPLLPAHAKVDVGAEEMGAKADVAAYLAHHVAAKAEPQSQRDAVLEVLRERSDGHFLYARQLVDNVLGRKSITLTEARMLPDSHDEFLEHHLLDLRESIEVRGGGGGGEEFAILHAHLRFCTNANAEEEYIHI